MARRALALGLALFTGCVSPTCGDRFEEHDGGLRVVRRGDAVILSACVVDARGDWSRFVRQDGVHWQRWEPMSLCSVGGIPDSQSAPRLSDDGYRVTRDLTSDPDAPPHWRVWERSGITWSLIATLPDDVAPGD